jgi:hypothetical protein
VETLGTKWDVNNRRNASHREANNRIEAQNSGNIMKRGDVNNSRTPATAERQQQQEF